MALKKSCKQLVAEAQSKIRTVPVADAIARHGDPGVESMVRHRRYIGSRHELTVHEVDQHRRVHPAELARDRQPVQVELVDLLENSGQPGGEHDLAVY